jgi:hypothetical protein
MLTYRIYSSSATIAFVAVAFTSTACCLHVPLRAVRFLDSVARWFAVNSSFFGLNKGWVRRRRRW